MIITVNGIERVIDVATLGELVQELGLRREGIAIARNDEVVARDAVDTTVLAAGDSIEIIAAVAGG